MPPEVSWGKRPRNQSSALANQMDAFVGARKTKRLNIIIPTELHTRVKAGCAIEGRDMTSILIEMLEKRFPRQIDL
ncbi:MAG: plasmid partition protein ParG [Acidobacteria bacterium]|nr:plasmid partition protein ParG [Acidobacteriota bacterium]